MNVLKKISAVLLAVIIIFCSVPVYYAFNSAINSYAPEGTRNLALDASASSSSPYEGSAGWWSVSNINDGFLQNETGGFTTSVSEDVPDEYTPAWILFDLEGYYYIKRTVLFPYGAYPDSYRIEVSEDGREFTQVASDSGLIRNRSIKSYDFESGRARYVRLYITKRGDFDGNAIRLVQLAEIAIFGKECSPSDDESDLTTFSPENCINLAPESKVSCADSIESENGSISLNHLTNGVNGDKLFFSTQSHDENYEDVDIDFDLLQYADIKRIKLFAWGIFPKDLDIQLSVDGKNYITVSSYSGMGWREGLTLDLSGSHFARYVRIHITGRNHGTGTEENCYYVQLGEIGIYGVKNAARPELLRSAVTLRAGESINQSFDIKTKTIYDFTPDIEWTVADPQTASFENGVIYARNIGKTTLTVIDTVTGLFLVSDINVKESYRDVTDGVITSVYGPGWDELLNYEQFRIIADAGIDLVYGIGGASVENNKNAMKYSYENGMDFIPADYDIYSNALTASEDEMRELYERYRGTSGFGGLFLVDEPKNPDNGYVKAYNMLKKIEPELFVHLNFLPGFVYDSYEQYEFQLDDYAVLTDNTDYIMFDIYPFLFNGGVDYKNMFDSYDAVRRSGLKNDVKTACYIQAVGYGGVNAVNFAKRVPTAADILYQDMISLAYGMKHLSYFKWGPGGSSPTEKFSDGGVDKNGDPTPVYYAIQAANMQVHALGKTLANLDAHEVYLSGSDTYSQPSVPDDFFVHSLSGSSLLFSFMKDRQTGRNFLMVVNNDVENAVSAPLDFDSGIDKISIADNLTGEFSEKSINGRYNLTLAAGDAALIALPESYRYEGTKTTNNRNLALGKRVTGTSSIGEDGWYLNCLTDGFITKNSDKGLSGWCSEKQSEPYNTAVTVDLGEIKQFNSINLYSADSATGARDYFPKSFTVSVSDDNVNWRDIAAENDSAIQSVANITFSAVDARYVRISVTDMNCIDSLYAAALAEVEITAEPKVERVYTNSDSPDGYYVYAFCAGADYVKMPTWTQKAVNGNAQDDIIWYDAQKGSWDINGKTYNYRYYVPVSEHNSEHGLYNTHVYAYNSYGEHALGTVFRFTNNFVFDPNYGNNSVNLITGLDSAISSGGVSVSYDSEQDTLTLNGTLEKSFTFLQYTPFNLKLQKGDTLRASVEFLSGNTDGYIVLDIHNAQNSNPLNKRMYHDFNKTGSVEFYIDSDELAEEISSYRLWIYKPETYSPTFDNLTFRIKLEIKSSDIYAYSPSGKSVEYSDYCGTFPVLENREDARFLGWFTHPVEGEQITAQTFNDSVGSTTLYAHWAEAGTQYVYSSQRLTAQQFYSQYEIQSNAEISGDCKGYMATDAVVKVRDSDGIVTQKYIFVLYGDLDCDSFVDGRDAVILNCIESGLLDEEDVFQAVLKAADCNNDSVVDNEDYSLIINAGLMKE